MTDAELHQRLLHLTNLLDQLGEPLWWMKLDLKRFFGDGRVASLGRFAHAYLWLLARMWERGGYIPANDRIIAHLLGIDVAAYVRTYKHRLEPMLVRLPDPHFGFIFSQKTCVDIMVEQVEMRLANKAKTSQATAARRGKGASKSKRRGNVTSTVTVEPKHNRNDDRNDAATDTVTITSKSREEEEALPIKKGESFFQPAGQGLGASSGDGRVAREGSLPPPTPALLRSKIVKGDRANGDATQPPPERGRDRRDQDQVPKPAAAKRTDAPAAGLFGIVEAARRKSEEEER